MPYRVEGTSLGTRVLPIFHCTPHLPGGEDETRRDTYHLSWLFPPVSLNFLGSILGRREEELTYVHVGSF